MVLLLGLDLAVIQKTQNLITIEELKEMQTMAKEKDSILSNSEEIGMLRETLLYLLALTFVFLLWFVISSSIFNLYMYHNVAHVCNYIFYGCRIGNEAMTMIYKVKHNVTELHSL